MSKLEKIIAKFLNLDILFTFQELEYLLGKFGYIEKKTGKTSGSRKAYIQEKTNHIIRIHKPHPENEIKRYVRVYLIDELKKENII